MKSKIQVEGCNEYSFFIEETSIKDEGVLVMAHRLVNPTRNHEVAGSVPGLVQWVMDLALP